MRRSRFAASVCVDVRELEIQDAGMRREEDIGGGSSDLDVQVSCVDGSKIASADSICQPPWCGIYGGRSTTVPDWFFTDDFCPFDRRIFFYLITTFMSKMRLRIFSEFDGSQKTGCSDTLWLDNIRHKKVITGFSMGVLETGTPFLDGYCLEIGVTDRTCDRPLADEAGSQWC